MADPADPPAPADPGGVPQAVEIAKAIVKELNTSAIGEGLRCLVEGPKDPDPVEPPPEGFRVVALQEIQPDGQCGKLVLKAEGPSGTKWDVEVCFEDAEQQNADKRQFQTGKLCVGGAVDPPLKLPTLWVQDPGPRFVTVYLRPPDQGPPQDPPEKRQEDPKTLIRVLPAAVSGRTTPESDEIDAVESAGDSTSD